MRKRVFVEVVGASREELEMLDISPDSIIELEEDVRHIDLIDAINHVLEVIIQPGSVKTSSIVVMARVIYTHYAIERGDSYQQVARQIFGRDNERRKVSVVKWYQNQYDQRIRYDRRFAKCEKEVVSYMNQNQNKRTDGQEA